MFADDVPPAPVEPPAPAAADNLPAARQSDPKEETFLSRSSTLKRMISAFQEPEAGAAPADSVTAALDADRSVDPLPDAPPVEPTLTRPPALEATILSASNRPLPPPEPAAPDVKPALITPAKPPVPRVIDAASLATRPDNALTGAPEEAPWTLQQFFNGEIDLDVELSKRFPAMPMLSIIKFRTLGTSSSRRVATLATQDNAATLTVDADVATRVIQLSFTLGSMLTLRFGLNDLSDMDRNRWLELMRRDAGGLAFLWGPERWGTDYMICISRKYFTNLYAFSPHNFEAAVRLTPAVTKQLLDWLDELWKIYLKPDDEPPTLLTW
ncbi:MAG: hypothetical protein MUE40_05175 [Anaerolineae bacterium]|jgi:hypothetical protein|nr:hypothetical protein [Anaerolineae bacterium]